MSVFSLCPVGDALLLDDSLDASDASRTWLVWSGAVEAALADAYRFSGGPLPSRGEVLGRGMARILACSAWWSQDSESLWYCC